MAGGSGTRFWPHSRKSRPKQLLKIYSNKTLLQETLDRAYSCTDSERVFIGTSSAMRLEILKAHPSFPADNFILEPQAKNTAPIIALAALRFLDSFNDVPFIVLSADHYIHPVSKFRKTVKDALAVAEEGYLVTIGIIPLRPDTGYGYLKKGEALKNKHGYKLKEFREKPDLKTALRYLKSWQYLWNAGIFIWKPSMVIEEMRKHCPQVLAPLEKYHPFRTAGDLAKAFALVEAESVDYALMEKSSRVAVVDADFTWDDVGSWLAYDRFFPDAGAGNRLKGNTLYSRDSSNNIVVSKKDLICLLGIQDTVIVEDEDVLFIAAKDKLGDIKALIGDLEKSPSLKKYLQ